MKVAVGISGGVDSAVAALLLKQQGCDVVGITLTLGRPDEEKSLSEARAVANRLGIELTVCDFATEWKASVLDYIGSTYRRGQTPNPCIKCNEIIKFGLLPQYALTTLGCERFATGHYARLEGSRLFRAVDRSKDQSYFLYRVDPEIRERTLFPLGNYQKSEIRAMAREFGYEAADRGDSQDFCGGDIASIVGTDPISVGTDPMAGPAKGRTIDTSGRFLGTNDGYWKYTIGQRKGLGIGGGGIPYYVVALHPETNEVVVGTRDEAISTTLQLCNTIGRIDFSLPVKVRSAGEPRLLSNGILGIAPGQSAVFYDGDEVVGGGIIATQTKQIL